MRRPTAETLVVHIAIFSAVVAATVASQAKPGCESKCGNLEIPYPFGMKEGCYLNINFSVTCKTNHLDSPKAFLVNSNIEVINISLYGELNILNYVARDCYTKDGLPDINNNRPSLRVPMFTISNTKNKLTVVGCDTYAYIYGQLEEGSYTSGCMGLCGNSSRAIKDGSCSGSGCCQLEIPKGLRNLELEVRSFKNHTQVHSFNPCGHAFVVQQDNFTFSTKYIENFTEDKVPLVLDWGIKKGACLTDQCPCGPNSKRNNSKSLDGSEYYCDCFDGFRGNPYLPQGCQGKIFTLLFFFR